MKCAYCNIKLEGRVDKKYCSSYCKSAFHNQKNKEKEKSLYVKIDKQLKQNRRLLKVYNKSGLSTVRKSKLIQDGFDANYFTHYWKNKKEQVYLFCYEYGFRSQGEKYILVTWQEYMNTRNK